MDALTEYDGIHTSILSYAELLVLFYDRERGGFDIDVRRVTADLLEVVPIVPSEHEQAVLAAADFIEEFDLTPFDALHAGVVVCSDESVLSSEGDYDDLELDRIPLMTE